MRYWLGDFVRSEDGVGPPRGVVGTLDLAPLELQSQTPQVSRGGGLFATPDGVSLPSEYVEISDRNQARSRDAFAKHVGYRPKGGTIAGMIADALTSGADPNGEAIAPPLVPGSDGMLEVYLGGRIWGERFTWGGDRTDTIKAVLRRQFAALFNDAKSGRLKDGEQHRRVLQCWCEKYRIEDWREFVPKALQRDVISTLPHETTYSDDFTRADESPLASPWATVSGPGFDVSSNQARAGATFAAAISRYDSDLSSDDHSVQLSYVSHGAGEAATSASGPGCRFSSAAYTGYFMLGKSDASPSDRQRLDKLVAGSATSLATGNFTEGSLPVTAKVSANGSTIRGYLAGVLVFTATDTAISGNLRGGMRSIGHGTAANRGILDAWIATDLTANLRVPQYLRLGGKRSMFGGYQWLRLGAE